MEAPSAPMETIIVNAYDIETTQIVPINNTTQNQIRRNKITCKIVVNGIIYIMLICAVTFIIYEHHKIIGFYLGKIDDIKV